VVASLTLAILAMGIQGSLAAQIHSADKIDRTVLPIAEPKINPITNVRCPPGDATSAN
jgi:hypothetical protein